MARKLAQYHKYRVEERKLKVFIHDQFLKSRARSSKEVIRRNRAKVMCAAKPVGNKTKYEAVQPLEDKKMTISTKGRSKIIFYNDANVCIKDSSIKCSIHQDSVRCRSQTDCSNSVMSCLLLTRKCSTHHQKVCTMMTKLVSFVSFLKFSLHLGYNAQRTCLLEATRLRS